MSNKPPVAPVEGPTAYLYNGYADLRIQFAGIFFEFPYKQTTVMKPIRCEHPDEWLRNHPSQPEENAMLERTYSAMELGNILFTRHDQNLLAEGVVILSDKEPNEEQKKRTHALGRIRKMRQVEIAQSERKAALQKGGRPEIDPQIVDWMIEYGVHDDTYNPIQQNALENSLAAALTAVANRAQPEPVHTIPAGRR